MFPPTARAALPFQAVTLRPPLAEELLEEEPLVDDAPPNRFRTICSLLLAGKSSVICCGLEPWGPTLNTTRSPPPLVGVMLMVICSGLVLLAALLRLRMISGPLPAAGPGWARVPPGPPPLLACFSAEPRSVAKAC